MPRCGCASECLCSVVGSGCVTVGGSGSPVSPYTVGLRIDPSEANGLSCGPDGLFAGGGAGATPEYGLLYNTGGELAVLPPAAVGVPSRAQAVYDLNAGSSAAVDVFPTGTGALPQAYMEILPGGRGLYIVNASVSGWTAGPAAAGDVIFRAGIGLSAAGGAAGLAGMPVYTSVAAPWNTPAHIFTGPLVMEVGDRVWVEVGVEDYSAPFPGATLTWGPVYDTTPTAGVAFTLVRVAAAP